jgi:hypothetical protein
VPAVRTNQVAFVDGLPMGLAKIELGYAQQ